MMKKVNVFLADGFEEIEGLTVVDLLRRAGIEVCTVSVTKDQLIHGAHGIHVVADMLFEEMESDMADMLVLPGGMPGTTHLKDHAGLTELIETFHAQEKYIAAICAAPSILGGLGILKGRKATCYPSVEDQLTGAVVEQVPVVIDGHIITGRGMGTAIDFSLAIITELVDTKKAKEIADAVVYPMTNRL